MLGDPGRENPMIKMIVVIDAEIIKEQSKWRKNEIIIIILIIFDILKY